MAISMDASTVQHPVTTDTAQKFYLTFTGISILTMKKRKHQTHPIDIGTSKQSGTAGKKTKN